MVFWGKGAGKSVALWVECRALSYGHVKYLFMKNGRSFHAVKHAGTH